MVIVVSCAVEVSRARTIHCHVAVLTAVVMPLSAEKCVYEAFVTANEECQSVVSNNYNNDNSNKDSYH